MAWADTGCASIPAAWSTRFTLEGHRGRVAVACGLMAMLLLAVSSSSLPGSRVALQQARGSELLRGLGVYRSPDQMEEVLVYEHASLRAAPVRDPSSTATATAEATVESITAATPNAIVGPNSPTTPSNGTTNTFSVPTPSSEFQEPSLPQTPGPKPSSGSASEQAGTPSPPGSEEFFCNRSSSDTVVCTVRGDVRMHLSSRHVTLLAEDPRTPTGTEVVRPQVHIDGNTKLPSEVHLESIFAPKTGSSGQPSDTTGDSSAGEPQSSNELKPPVRGCDVVHEDPAIVFASSGYCSNFYHDMDEKIIPLFISAYAMDRNVMLIVTDLHCFGDGWLLNYAPIFRALSRHPVLRADQDEVHCFPRVQVGLQYHHKVTVFPGQMRPLGTTIGALAERVLMVAGAKIPPPRRMGDPYCMLLLHRDGSRKLINEKEVAQVARHLGFRVSILKDYSNITHVIEKVQAHDVLVGIHGAAIANAVFMQPSSVVVEVAPFNTDAQANFSYANLERHVHRILVQTSYEESSLAKEHPPGCDPNRLKAEDFPDWFAWRDCWLDQDVTVSIPRIQVALEDSRQWLAAARLRAGRGN